MALRSVACTEGIVIEVQSEYVAQRSEPAQHRFFFVYHVTIRNEGDVAAQLLTRHWIITNAEGMVQEVRGPGVVGYTPLLMPGQEFAYTSACPLDTPVGSMHGSFQLVRPDGQQFDALIAPFTLARAELLN